MFYDNVLSSGGDVVNRKTHFAVTFKACGVMYCTAGEQREVTN